ncbi:hypothetical protein DPMN_118238 [Dreissena polymorpha]|uniref:Uncharacterized protein n=1 Tax=Dreissena polymorpha TaxID=45954 RepID=A0A9D4GH08_DREPO|nr:hypothetical protein DPMN_118238 [Dreissena polymorpha]
MYAVDEESLESIKQRITVQDVEVSLSGEKISSTDYVVSKFESIRSSDLTSMQKNVQARFKKADVSIFEELSRVFEPSVVCSHAQQEEGTEAVEHLCAFYG